MSKLATSILDGTHQGDSSTYWSCAVTLATEVGQLQAEVIELKATAAVGLEALEIYRVASRRAIDILDAKDATIAQLRAALTEACDCIEGWVQCETQHARHEDDLDWMLAQRLRKLAQP